jgi:DNA-3-methyladenine glycosylase
MRAAAANTKPTKLERPLPRSFYALPAIELAPKLIGTTLVHRVRGRQYRARIVETEAYVGPHDLACHASKGRTKRTEVMFGPAGRSYVYLIYGMYPMLNIVCSVEGDAQAVLIRAAEPLAPAKWKPDLSGPGKLCRDMRIVMSDNALDLAAGRKLFLVAGGSETGGARIETSPRIGVDYAGDEWRDAHLRFYDADSGAVSRRR